MARRFSRVRNGQVYADALTRYQAWLAESTQRRNDGVGTGTAKPPMIDKAITPFGLTLATGAKAKIKISQPAFNVSSTNLGTRLAAPGAADVRVNGFKPAKIVLFVGTGSGVAATSDITGMKYLKYSGTSYTIPFGQDGTSTEKEYDAYEEISTALLAAGTNRRVSYQAETVKAR